MTSHTWDMTQRCTACGLDAIDVYLLQQISCSGVGAKPLPKDGALERLRRVFDAYPRHCTGRELMIECQRYHGGSEAT